MQSDSDYDSDEDIDYSKETNTKVEDFRRKLSEWKQTQVDSILGENQDTMILNAYLKKSGSIYNDFQDHIELGKPLSGKSGAEEILAFLPDLSSLDVDTRIQLLHILFRDLVEFPFTYDTKYTNSLQKEEAFDTNILSNK